MRTTEDILRELADKSANTQVSSQDMAAIYPPKPSGFDVARSAFQGATLYFSDEIEAAMKTALGSDKSYRENVAEIREKLKRFQETNPSIALSSELVGAIVPALLTGGSSAAAQGTTRLAQLGSLARTGAIEGGVAAFGASDINPLNDPVGSAITTATGAATGGFLSPFLGSLGEGVVTVAQNIGGKGSATKVKAELQRLAESTGKTVDEIVEDIAAGRIMAENKTLLAAVKVYVSKTSEGGAGAKARAKATERKEQTQKRAELKLREGLAPQSPRLGENLEQGFLRTDEELRLLERQDYQAAFPEGVLIPDDLTELVVDAINRVPAIGKDLNEIARAEGLPALVVKNKETKKLELSRPLEIMDVETARRVLRDRTKALYMKGRGTVAAPTANVRERLQNLFFSTFDGSNGRVDVRPVVARAALRRQRSDAFKQGQAALGQGIEQVELLVNEMAKNPEIMPAFRAGFMSSLRNKITAQKNPMEVIAGDSALGPKVTAVFPNAQVDELLEVLETARGAEELDKFLRGGSPTAPMQIAEGQIGTGALNVGANLMSGNMAGAAAAGLQSLQRLVAEATPQLNQSEQAAVLKVLMQESPSAVREALDPSQSQILRQKIGRAASMIGNYTRQRATTMSGGLIGENLSEEYRNR